MITPLMPSLLETRMVDHHHLTQDLGFNCQIQSSAIGLSMGIMLMWKEDLLSINDNVAIEVVSLSSFWFLSIIYASNKVGCRY